ncbi:MAG: 3-hydroxybutyrate dehydrogenase [Bacteroidota bacterium]
MSTKTALITGGTSGIGLGIAKAFAEAGYNLMLNGLEEDGAEIAKKIAKKHDITAHFSNANLLEPDSIQALAHEALELFDSIQVLVYSAGMQHVDPLEEFPSQKWEMIIGLNLSGAFYLTKALWPSMQEQKFGRIINIASAHGLRASPFKSAYVASKHGIVGLTKVLALEGAEHNITANSICPGYVRTPLVEGQIADQAEAHDMSEEEVIEKVILEEHAKKEFVTIDLIAEMALFLASEKASSLTGAALPLDAGWTSR